MNEWRAAHALVRTLRGSSAARWMQREVAVNSISRMDSSELQAMGHKVSATKVGLLLHELNYRLQLVRKTREGGQSRDRNAQFEHINRTAKAFMKRGHPLVPVDTKKKELVGDFKNAGHEWPPKGSTEPVRVHDFIDRISAR